MWTEKWWRCGICEAEESVGDAEGDGDEASDEECSWCYGCAHAVRLRGVVGCGVGWLAAEVRCVCAQKDA